MQNTEDPFVKKWKKVREKGLLRHLITTGLSFGILLFVVLTAWNYFVTDQTFTTTYDFIVQLLICIVFGGGIYALITWFLNEYIYNKKTKGK
ncbi:hypothetical protein [Mesohalobacter halotolerans]|mgnify:CR=1 FL=1|uniref:Uncharacterized protein n=1 Tax=Mesohalobacter halotolerans TaxID=1883405 RepID=A0A4U5TTC7_9FLAO|nr:hypothetical protein [Mesohalobacter halotolerans]TKS57302.1 hypothetical protein FCN74_02465 [Mesohalobacter halotolerans]